MGDVETVVGEPELDVALEVETVVGEPELDVALEVETVVGEPELDVALEVETVAEELELDVARVVTAVGSVVFRPDMAGATIVGTMVDLVVEFVVLPVDVEEPSTGRSLGVGRRAVLGVADASDR